MKFHPVFLLSLLPLASGQTFEDCTDCLGLLPDVWTCFVDSDRCDIFSCDITDIENCNCFNCLKDVLTCVDDCIPDCLDTSANAYVDCLTDPVNDCYNSCRGEIVSATVTIFPPLVPPEDCDFSDLFNNFGDCLPTWPECDAVQESFIPSTCEETECCSVCHTEMLDVENCFYNWLSGRDCTFECPAALRRLGYVQELPRKLADNEEPPEFVNECHHKLATDLILKTDASFDDYMECLVSNSMELAVDESNNPANLNNNGTSGASHHAIMVLPMVFMAWILQLM